MGLERKYGGTVHTLVAPPVRMLLGLILGAGFVLWLVQNKAVNLVDVAENARATISNVHNELSAEGKEAVRDVQVREPRTQLDLPVVPGFIEAPLSTWNNGIAAAVLVVSFFFAGKLLGFFVVPAALMMVFGRWLGIEAISPIPQSDYLLPTTLIIGLVIAGTGFWKFRE